ncbi:MAG: DegT/DnrJ/EryC1/StrS family aminotransferase [Candidatus Nanoarchaeia archaeon]|nr:DegT/DnrJ/EryC1/StrS family aminotransferase [Candidatus Nanoarchaeia archaeon]
MKIPFLDLNRSQKDIRKQIDEAIKNVIDEGNFILGSQVNKFEEELNRYFGVKHSISVASGSDALFLALKAIDIKEGDEVITTPFTFFATAGAISRCNAKPVFVDIDQDYNINTEKIKEVITKKTKAIIPVHLFGLPCNMNKIMKIAKDYNLKVIEDSAQAFGTKFEGKKISSFGDAGCLSFFPTKNLGGVGDGGAIITNDDELAEKIRILRVHGSKPKYYNKYIGINSRLDTLQAAILLVKFPYLEKWNKQRNEAAKIYNDLLKNVKEISCPVYLNGRTYNLYSIIIDEENRRNKLMEYLTKEGIGTGIYYPFPLHLQECYLGLGYKEGDFPETEKVCKSILSIPLFPGITKEEQEYIVSKIKEFFIKGE